MQPLPLTALGGTRERGQGANYHPPSPVPVRAKYDGRNRQNAPRHVYIVRTYAGDIVMEGLRN